MGQNSQQQNQYMAPNVQYSQYGDPALSAMGNSGLASAMGLALASGRTPVAMSNNDPRLGQAIGQVNSRWGGGVNAQDSLQAQAMQAYRGFGPGEMEATQRVDNPWQNIPGYATQAMYGTGSANPLNAMNRQPTAFQNASSRANPNGGGGAGAGGNDGGAAPGGGGANINRNKTYGSDGGSDKSQASARSGGGRFTSRLQSLLNKQPA
jgi:hypothetical protein